MLFAQLTNVPFAYHSIVSFFCQGLQPDLCKGHGMKLSVFFVTGETKLTWPSTVRLPTQLAQLNWLSVLLDMKAIFCFLKSFIYLFISSLESPFES